jgi:hypothetical protein
MSEESDILKEAVKGFVKGVSIPFGVAVGTLLLLLLRQVRVWALAFLHYLAPTRKEAVTIFLCLSVVVLLWLVFSFVRSLRRSRRYVEAMYARLEDLKSGKIKIGELTLEELAFLHDKIPPHLQQPVDLSAFPSRLDQLRII